MTDAAGLKRIVRPVFAVLAAAFVVYAAQDLWSRWDGIKVEVQLGYLILATVASGVAMYVQLVAWRVLIFTLTGKMMPSRLSARLYLDSQMARYTPGKVGLPVVRVAGAASVGVTPEIMGSALLVELVSWVATGTLVGAATLSVLPSAGRVAKQLEFSSLVIVALALLGLSVVLFVDRRRFPLKVQRLFGGDAVGPLMPLRVPALHVLHFLVWTIAGALVGLSVGVEIPQATAVGGLLCLAIVAGFVALLAPAGAGVREAIVAAGLAPSLGVSTSLAIGILARVASLVSDVVLWIWFRSRAGRTP